MEPIPAGPPPSVRDCLRGLGLGADEVEWVGPDSGTLWVALTPDQVVYVAHDDATRSRVAIEHRRMRWACEQGIPVPEVIELHPAGLVTRRVPDDGLSGGGSGLLAVEVARAIAAAPPPPGDVLAGGGGVRPPAPDGPLTRLLRVVRGPMPVREFLALRRAAAALPRDTLVHGDFQPRNLLFDHASAEGPSGVVRVIDWELLGYAPAGTDLFCLWPQIEDADARTVVLDGALAAVDDPGRAAVLHLWLSLRYLADVATVPDGRRDPARVRAASARLRDARANARRWRVPVAGVRSRR